MSQPAPGKLKRGHSVGDLSSSQTADFSNVPSTSGESTSGEQVRKKAKRTTRSTVTNVNANATSDPSSGAVSEVDALRQQVSGLTTTVQQQASKIALLEQRLNDVLAAFGIAVPAVAAAPLIPGGPIVAEQSSSSAAAAAVRSGPSTPGVGLPSSQPSAKTVRTIHESLVAAVYIDKAASERRAASFIVSGLAPSTTSSDADVVTALCEDEIGIRPVIKSTKRLGRPTAGKVQPVLVQLNNSDSAKHIVSQAKRLRQSSNLSTRNNVYINANLTKAEAMAAYAMRCNRRQAANIHPNGGTQNSSAPSQMQPPQTSSSNAPLNPGAADFHPSA